MQVIEKNTDGLRREFNVVVAASSIEEKVTTRLSEVGNQVRLPGFRPGKVPMNILKQRFGEAVRGEVLEKTIDESTQAAISEKALKPALQPRIEVVTFEEGKDLEFAVKLEVLPEIAAADFSKIELTRPVATVTDAELEKAIDQFVKTRRSAETVNEVRGARKGDGVIIDFVGRTDGKEFAGGSAKDTMIEIGSGVFIPGFEDQLIGAVAGQNLTVKVKFPDDYKVKELAGKNAEFDVTVKSLVSLVAPVMNDEYARSLGDENAEALKNRMRKYQQEQYDAAARVRMKRELLDKLADGHNFAIPQGMVDVEFDAIWRQMDEVRRDGQVDPEDIGKTDDQLKAEYRAIAERRVRLGLLLSDVGQRNNISVTQDDITKAVTAEAYRYPGQEAAVVDFYQKNPQAIEQLRAPIFEEKVVDFIISKAKITDQTVDGEKLMGDADNPVTDKDLGKKG